MGYLSGSLRELAMSHFFDVQLSNIFMGIGAVVEVPLVTMLGRRLSYSTSTIANFVTLVAVCRVFADIPSGVLAEYVDLRQLMSYSVLAYAFGCIAAFFLPTGFISLTLFSILSGSSVGVFFLSRHIYVARISKREHRGIVLSFLAGMLRWSHVIGPFLLGSVASITNDVHYFFLVPLASALVAWLCIQIQGCGGKNIEEEEKEEEKEKESLVNKGNNNNNVIVFTKTDKNKIVTVPSYESTSISPSDEDNNNNSNNNDYSTIVELSGSRVSYCSCVSNKGDSSFQLKDFWFTIVDHWSVIWRLGIYIILYVSLRANRKLLLTFAAMQLNFSDSHIALLLSLSFSFDAVLFPIGGAIMDIYGRRKAMLPVVLGLGISFALLPLFQTIHWLYFMSALFGTMDALGCGLVMTLIADQAPKRSGGPFFGVMRTVQDMGHVAAAVLVAVMMKQLNFQMCCYVWGGVGVVAAAWGHLVVPLPVH